MRKGFTLAELLIALAILGVIATFTIPKVLLAQQEEKNNAIGKEVAGMISGAYQAYQQANGSTPSTMTSLDLTPYMNYVSLDTATVLDNTQTRNSRACSGTERCVKLHSGAVLLFIPYSFNGTASTNSVWFHLDPDGSYSGTTDGPGKAVKFALYYTGRLVDDGSVLTGTQSSFGSHTADPTGVPPWFSWD